MTSWFLKSFTWFLPLFEVCLDGREGSVVIGEDSDGSIPDGFNVTITGDVTDNNRDDSVDVTNGSVKRLVHTMSGSWEPQIQKIVSDSDLDSRDS